MHEPAGTTLVLLRLVRFTLIAELKLASVKGVNAVVNSTLACMHHYSRSMKYSISQMTVVVLSDALAVPIPSCTGTRLQSGHRRVLPSTVTQICEADLFNTFLLFISATFCFARSLVLPVWVQGRSAAC